MTVASGVRAPWYRLAIGGDQVELAADPTQNAALEGVVTTVLDAEIESVITFATNVDVTLDQAELIRSRIAPQFAGVVNHVSGQSFPNRVVLTCVGPLARLRRCPQNDHDLTGMTDGEAVQYLLTSCGITFDTADIADSGYVLGAQAPVLWLKDQPGHEVLAELDRVFGTATIEVGAGRVVRFAYDRAPAASDIGRTYSRGIDAEFWGNQRDRGDLDAIVNLVQVRGATWQNDSNCVIEGTIVDAATVNVIWRRGYDGDVVRFKTESGHELTVTPNHPMLTPSGWKAAHLVNEGDDLISGSVAENAANIDPNVQDGPSRVEQVFAAASNLWLRERVNASPLDFHGDGRHGEVDVVSQHGHLGRRIQPARDEQIGEFSFLRSDNREVALAGFRGPMQDVFASDKPARGDVRIRGDALAVFGGHPAIALGREFGAASQRHTEPHKAVSQGDVAGVEHRLNVGDGLARQVEINKHVVGRIAGSRIGAASFDACLIEPFADGLPIDPIALAQGESGLTRDVRREKVVSVEIVQYSGHVYNLSTDEGWYFANGIITHNCSLTPWGRGSANNSALGTGVRNRSSEFSSDLIQDEALAGAVATRLLRWYNRQPDELTLIAVNDLTVNCGDVIGVKDEITGIDLTGDATAAPYLVLTVDRRGDEMTLALIGGAAGSTGTITTGVEKVCNQTSSNFPIAGLFSPIGISGPPLLPWAPYDCALHGHPGGEGVCPDTCAALATPSGCTTASTIDGQAVSATSWLMAGHITLNDPTDEFRVGLVAPDGDYGIRLGGMPSYLLGGVLGQQFQFISASTVEHEAGVIDVGVDYHWVLLWDGAAREFSMTITDGTVSWCESIDVPLGRLAGGTGIVTVSGAPTRSGEEVKYDCTGGGGGTLALSWISDGGAWNFSEPMTVNDGGFAHSDLASSPNDVDWTLTTTITLGLDAEQVGLGLAYAAFWPDYLFNSPGMILRFDLVPSTGLYTPGPKIALHLPDANVDSGDSFGWAAGHPIVATLSYDAGANTLTGTLDQADTGFSASLSGSPADTGDPFVVVAWVITDDDSDHTGDSGAFADFTLTAGS